MKKLGLIITAVLFISTGLFAQSTKTPIVNKKQKNQISRIEQGVYSGELTKRETRKLIKQEAKLQKQKKIAKSDGVVTKRERAKLNHEANKLSAKIYKQKHDRQKRK